MIVRFSRLCIRSARRRRRRTGVVCLLCSCLVDSPTYVPRVRACVCVRAWHALLVVPAAPPRPARCSDSSDSTSTTTTTGVHFRKRVRRRPGPAALSAGDGDRPILPKLREPMRHETTTTAAVNSGWESKVGGAEAGAVFTRSSAGGVRVRTIPPFADVIYAKRTSNNNNHKRSCLSGLSCNVEIYLLAHADARMWSRLTPLRA